jgi:small subunit ribosomal protein S1
MANKALLRELGPKEDELEKVLIEIFSDDRHTFIEKTYSAPVKSFKPETIVKGKIVNVVGKSVLIDIGYKSEGIIPTVEFTDKEINRGEEIEAFIESIDDETGLITLSKQKADKLRGWEKIIKSNKEDTPLTGKVIRKVKSGLIVDAGIPVFLPLSHLDIRKVDNIDEFIGKVIQCKILKIDEERMNVIVSRKKYIEDERIEKKRALLSTLKEGDKVKGIVKCIMDYGVFVDLDGIDGLLHISDMSWGRVGHPSEVVKLNQEIEAVVIRIDKENEKIGLGIKQITKDPWEDIAVRYPIGSKAKGNVVNILPYGIFVELEKGIEGLVHVSEMSWTKRVTNPAEEVSMGEVVEVVIIGINAEERELSLGMKQAHPNPWELVEERHKPGSKETGIVKNFTIYGAFVELEDGLDGLLHVNDLSWTKRIIHPSDVLRKGEKIEVMVLSVDKEKRRIALGLKQLYPNPWETTIPEKYAVGTVTCGKITKVASFGAFLELEKDLEGLLYLPKNSGDAPTVTNPELVVGNTIDVRVVRLDPKEQKIGLSMVKKEEQQQQTTKEESSQESKNNGS